MDSVSNDVLQSLGISSRENLQSQSKGSDELGVDQYLDLMIAQIRNQDPFEPMSNGDFIGQLAQFGTVSGIEELQESFGSFSNSITSGQSLQAAALVGHTVQVPGNILSLGETGSVSGAVDVSENASAVRVTVTDALGNVLKNIELGAQQPGRADFVWDGTDTSGTRLPPGDYRVSAQISVNNETIAANTLSDQRVSSVVLGGLNENIELNLASGETVFLNEVREIR